MNRHVRIFWGIFCWICVAVCATLALLNGIATPASGSGVLFFSGVGFVMVLAGTFLVRDRSRV